MTARKRRWGVETEGVDGDKTSNIHTGADKYGEGWIKESGVLDESCASASACHSALHTPFPFAAHCDWLDETHLGTCKILRYKFGEYYHNVQ